MLLKRSVYCAPDADRVDLELAQVLATSTTSQMEEMILPGEQTEW